MNTTDLLVLGLLVLVANLTLSALFVPPRTRPSATEPLVRLWKLLGLAFAQIAAWAIVLDQGGAAPSLADAFLRTAGCFALVSGVQGGPGFAPPWNTFAGLIALNGLLFVPVTLLPALFASTGAASPVPETDSLPSFHPSETGRASQDTAHERTHHSAPPTAHPTARDMTKNTAPVVNATAHPAPLDPAASSASAPAAHTTGTAPLPNPTTPQPTALSAAASPLVAAASAVPGAGVEPSRRPAAQPAPPRPAESVDPEAEYAALMRPIGPTPPPIRFGNRP